MFYKSGIIRGEVCPDRLLWNVPVTGLNCHSLYSVTVTRSAKHCQLEDLSDTRWQSCYCYKKSIILMELLHIIQTKHDKDDHHWMEGNSDVVNVSR